MDYGKSIHGGGGAAFHVRFRTVPARKHAREDAQSAPMFESIRVLEIVVENQRNIASSVAANDAAKNGDVMTKQILARVSASRGMMSTIQIDF